MPTKAEPEKSTRLSKWKQLFFCFLVYISYVFQNDLPQSPPQKQNFCCTYYITLLLFCQANDILSWLRVAFVSTKAVLVKKSRQTFGAHKPKAPLCKGSWRRRRLRDCFTMKFCFYNPSVSLARATSLYTREAHYRPTVHRKGVTHYTLQSKACEKEYEQSVRTPFVVGRGVSPAVFFAYIVCFRRQQATALRVCGR